MDANKADFPIRFMASRLGVSTSGFYEWRQRLTHPSPRTVSDAELTDLIREIHTRSRGTYGSPRTWADLRFAGKKVGRKRVERLMRQAGLCGTIRSRKTQTTRRNPNAVPSDDLVNRRFRVDEPDQLWVADITEHPTAEGKVYVAAVLDAWNREVIGWSITDHLRAEIVCDALDMACWRRRPQADSGLVHHTDHGTQTRFKGWLQHFDVGGVDGQTSWMDEGVDGSVGDEVAGGAVASSGGGAGVLA